MPAISHVHSGLTAVPPGLQVQERVVSGLSALPDSNGSGGWEHAYLATMQTPGTALNVILLARAEPSWLPLLSSSGHSLSFTGKS